MEVEEAEDTGGVVGDQEFSPELLRFFYGALCSWWMGGSISRVVLVDGATLPPPERFARLLTRHTPLHKTTARLFPYTQMFKWLSYGNGAWPIVPFHIYTPPYTHPSTNTPHPIHFN